MASALPGARAKDRSATFWLAPILMLPNLGQTDQDFEYKFASIRQRSLDMRATQAEDWTKASKSQCSLRQAPTALLMHLQINSMTLATALPSLSL